jgi:hypothetical protein
MTNDPIIEHRPIPLCGHGKIRCEACRTCTHGHYERRPIPNDDGAQRRFTVGKFVPAVSTRLMTVEAGT